MDTIVEESVGTETPSGSAPAIAEPSSTPTESTRPTSMREAMERLDKKRDTAPPDAATTPQAVTKPVAPQGPIPFEVHQKALENARTKASTEALTHYREKFGWAEKIPQQQLQQWGALASRISTDPIGYAADLIREIEQHPVHGPAWKARAGQSARTAETPLDPDVQIVDDKGNITGATFSADRVKAIVQRAVAEAIGKEVQPLKSDYEQRQADLKRQEHDQLQAQQTEFLNKSVETAFSEVRKILEIKSVDTNTFTADENALIEEVNKTMAQNPGMTAHTAALNVREQKVVPKLKGAATQEAITEMQRKANGNTANGGGRTAMPKRPTTPKELAVWMRNREQSAS